MKQTLPAWNSTPTLSPQPPAPVRRRRLGHASHFAAALCMAGALGAQTTPHPTGNRTTPPTLNAVTPLGVARGATVEINIEGLNLARATAIYFSEPGIQARIVRIKELPDLPDIRLGSNGTPSTIDLGPLPPRNEITVELDVAPEAQVGPVNFRVQTPLGTSPEGRILVEPYYGESPDREPNDTAERAFESYTPTILVGTISRAGDLDYYKIKAQAGEELVFDNAGPQLGSSLQPIVELYDAGQNLVKRFGEEGGMDAHRFAYRFEKPGVYYVRVSDYQETGSGRHFYRFKVGKFPLAVSAWPLGVPKGKTAEVKLAGYNLPARLEVRGEPSAKDERAAIVRPKGAFNELKLALGEEPEVEAAAAGVLAAPVTVNGSLKAPHADFRFQARKGQKLVFEVAAARLGSRLDSQLEVLDAQGRAIERTTLRCVLETNTTLRDHDSVGPGIRINSSTGFQVGDTVLIGSELLRIEAMPRTPDDDFRFESFGGQRIALLDTTSEAHALDRAVYKVQVHPPGAKFAPNGLPVVRLPYRNDDGGPGFGKDSRLRFTAPADGEYTVRLRDVRGLSGDDYAYRLTLREPRPDFQLSVAPRNPNVPAGGRIPLTVTALRMDDFDGAIEVTLEGLPPGLTAGKGVIAPGQVSTTLLLAADENAPPETAAPLKVVGRAGSLAHPADPGDPLKLIAVMPKPDIQMQARTREVTLEPGGTAEVEVAITRNNEYGGRVPVEVRNLPPGVRVLDVGLNGVLINEDENVRRFTLEALPTAEPIEQAIVVAGKVETRADAQQTSYAAEPILLKVKPGVRLAVGR